MDTADASAETRALVEKYRLDDLTNARAEFDDLRLSLERALADALASGRSVRHATPPPATSGSVLGPPLWDHAAIDAETAGGGGGEVRGLPAAVPEGTALQNQATLMVSLRTALLACSWAEASSWAPLYTVLDGVAIEQRALEEVEAAEKEAAEMREVTEKAVKSAMAAGGVPEALGGGVTRASRRSSSAKRSRSSKRSRASRTPERRSPKRRSWW